MPPRRRRSWLVRSALALLAGAWFFTAERQPPSRAEEPAAAAVRTAEAAPPAPSPALAPLPQEALLARYYLPDLALQASFPLSEAMEKILALARSCNHLRNPFIDRLTFAPQAEDDDPWVAYPWPEPTLLDVLRALAAAQEAELTLSEESVIAFVPRVVSPASAPLPVKPAPPAYDMTLRVVDLGLSRPGPDRIVEEADFQAWLAEARTWPEAAVDVASALVSSGRSVTLQQLHEQPGPGGSADWHGLWSGLHVRAEGEVLRVSGTIERRQPETGVSSISEIEAFIPPGRSAIVELGNERDPHQVWAALSVRHASR